VHFPQVDAPSTHRGSTWDSPTRLKWSRPETSRLLAERRAQTTVSDEEEQVSVPGEEVTDGGGEQLVEVTDGPVPAGDPGLRGLTAHVRPSCTGTGTDGNRVQLVYAVEQGKANRYQDLLPMLRSWVADVEDTFALSSQKTGGGLRVRWVHNNCVPVIAAEVLPGGALTNGFSATVKELKARGYTSKTPDIGVFRKGTWFLRMSATGGATQSKFGYGRRRTSHLPATGTATARTHPACGAATRGTSRTGSAPAPPTSPSATASPRTCQWWATGTPTPPTRRASCGAPAGT
jgi:hypothetical protein